MSNTLVIGYSTKMKLFAVGCFFLAYFVHVLFASHKGCSLTVNGTNEKNLPILLSPKDELIVTANGKVQMDAGEYLAVACTGPKNYFVGTTANFTEAQCVQGNTLRSPSHDFSFSDLECKRTIRGQVSSTNQKCALSGRILKIGYETPRTFVPLIHVCFANVTGEVFYTEHLLHGRDIKHASKSNYRPAFSPEAGGSTAFSVAYKRPFQKSTFSKLLKSSKLASVYIHDNSYLARGHLSPDADFLFASWQYTSYYYINTAPQWQVINAGNWKRIENAVRKVAAKLRTDLHIITGTFAVLHLPNIDEQLTEIYLNDRKLPVPKFLWKVVYEPKSGKAVVLVSLNNPFVESVSSDDMLCEDVCKDYGWASESWSDVQKGLVYCCDYVQFSKAVVTVPKITVSGMLQGPR